MDAWDYINDPLLEDSHVTQSPPSDLAPSNLSLSSLPGDPPRDIDDFRGADQSAKQALLPNVASLGTSAASHFPDSFAPISGATSGTVTGPSDNPSSITDTQLLCITPGNSSPEPAHNAGTSNPTTFPKKHELPLNASGKGKIDERRAVQDGTLHARTRVVLDVGTFNGACLQFPGNFRHQYTLTVGAAVTLLLQGAQASYRTPYSWGYIDRPADGAVYLVFVGPRTSFPEDGLRFRADEQCSTVSVGNDLQVEVMETKYGFVPGPRFNAADYVRRKYRLIKGGNPQLVVAHYSQGWPTSVNPTLNRPIRMYPLPPIDLPAVYIAGAKAGQRVMLSTASDPDGESRGGHGGMHSNLAKRPPPTLSDDDGTFLPARRRKPSELQPLPPSKKRKLAAGQPPAPNSLSPRTTELPPFSLLLAGPGGHFSAQSAQEGANGRGEAQSQGNARGPPLAFKPPLSSGSSLQHLTSNPITLTQLQRAALTWEFLHETAPSFSGEGLEGGILAGTKHFSAPSPSILFSSDEPAWKRLISRTFFPHGVASLLREVFMSKDQVKAICDLHGNDAQIFVNVLHEALDLPDLIPRLRGKCIAALCRICGRQGLLPKTLRVRVYYDRSGAPLYRGGFADVWKAEYRGSDVAVKVLRTYSTTDLDKITNRFCKEVVTWNALCHPNVLSFLGVIMDKGQCAMVSEWMDNGNINEFVKQHWEANRFELLKDVAMGLIYIHSQGMIHGDLKGANILIGRNGRAKLADFGLLTIVSEPTYFTASTSTAMGGTTRWMSPELLHPEFFGLDQSQPTKESDCYALGMVVYEVLCGKAPFAAWKEYIVIRKVIEGGRPERPEGPIGAWFTSGKPRVACRALCA